MNDGEKEVYWLKQDIENLQMEVYDLNQRLLKLEEILGNQYKK